MSLYTHFYRYERTIGYVSYWYLQFVLALEKQRNNSRNIGIPGWYPFNNKTQKGTSTHLWYCNQRNNLFSKPTIKFQNGKKNKTITYIILFSTMSRRKYVDMRCGTWVDINLLNIKWAQRTDLYRVENNERAGARLTLRGELGTPCIAYVRTILCTIRNQRFTTAVPTYTYKLILVRIRTEYTRSMNWLLQTYKYVGIQ